MLALDASIVKQYTDSDDSSSQYSETAVVTPNQDLNEANIKFEK